MLSEGSPLSRMMDAPVRPGSVAWIGVRPARRQPLLPTRAAGLDPVSGVEGDHYGGGPGSARQVTLIGLEDLAAIGSYLGLGSVDPGLLRRNIVVSGINLHALKACRVRLGTALLEITGACHPCSRMEETLGPGGYNAVRGHGGLTARIVEAGRVALGDPVERA